MDSVEVMESCLVHFFRIVQKFMRRFMRQANITERQVRTNGNWKTAHWLVFIEGSITHLKM